MESAYRTEIQGHLKLQNKEIIFMAYCPKCSVSHPNCKCYDILTGEMDKKK